MSIFEEIDTPDGVPAPINPQSTPSANVDRVAWENWVNAEVASFVELARTTMTEALVSGLQPGDVSIVVKGEHRDDEAPISEATALLAAIEAGVKPYSEWLKDDLIAECQKRDITTHSKETKDELIAHLEESDAKEAEALLSDDPDDELDDGEG